MKKEDILKASREENKKRDLASIEVENKAIKLSALSILFLVTIYFCLGIIIKGETNYGLYSIISLYCSIFFGYKAIKEKKKINILSSIIWSLVTIILIIQYIQAIIQTSTII